ncbi:hypothetical protein M513_02212 [Trichuris suis]|uniref:Uncharacterized protein n=1 Tax=Trichuris suis TaxID=68888 RepID=A0A085MIA9_9BILA|nr:hypothetical protein M513_02212 [Trichuris suis]
MKLSGLHHDFIFSWSVRICHLQADPNAYGPVRSAAMATELVGSLQGPNIGTAATRDYQQGVICAIVPVRLRCSGRFVENVALLDSGSEATLMDRRVADRLYTQLVVNGSFEFAQ